jgi:hypothetical protein
MESPETIKSRELINLLMDQMGQKGFMFVGLIGYKLGAERDQDAVKVGSSVDFMQHPRMKPIVIRMLKNAATILEAGGNTQTVEIIGEL